MNKYQEKYIDLYKTFGFPDYFIKFIRGEIDYCYKVNHNIPFVSWGFPPALLPFLSDSTFFRYDGYWMHWFCDRKPTIVEYIDGRVVEKARDFLQYATIIAMNDIFFEDNVTSRIEKFAKQVGLTNLSELDYLSSNYPQGDGIFKYVSNFQNNLPSNLVSESDVIGTDFPTKNFDCSIENLKTVCSFELSEDQLIKVSNIPECPEWLLEDKQSYVFEQYLERKDLLSCWMTINSSGWILSDAVLAMEKLVGIVTDKQFIRMAEAWLSAQSGQVIERY